MSNGVTGRGLHQVSKAKDEAHSACGEAARLSKELERALASEKDLALKLGGLGYAVAVAGGYYSTLGLLVPMQLYLPRPFRVACTSGA